MFRNLFLVALFLCCLFYSSVCIINIAYAQQLPTAEELSQMNVDLTMQQNEGELAQLAAPALKDNIITVGYREGDNIIDNPNNPTKMGYGYDVLKKIEEVSDLKFEFVNLDENNFDALRNRDIELTGLFFHTEERDAEFAYAQIPFNAIFITLSTKDMDHDLPYGDPQSLNGKTVATYASNAANAIFDDYLRINDIEVEYVMSDLANYMDEEADFYLTFSASPNIENLDFILNLGRKQTFLVANPEDQQMLDLIDQAMLKLVNEEGAFFSELETRYYEDVFHNIHRDLTLEETEYIESSSFRVGFVENHNPYSYVDANGNPNGAVVELMQYLSDMYDFDIELVPYHSIHDGGAGQTGYDIVISALGDYSTAVEEYDFTQSYYEMDLVAMVPQHISEQYNSADEIIANSNKIGVLSYMYIHENMFYLDAENQQIINYTNFDDLLDAYANQEIDMALFTESGITYANAYFDDSSNYVFAPGYELNYHFAIAKDISEQVLPIFNIMLDNITDRKYEDILVSHTSVFFPEYTLWQYMQKYWYNAVIFLAVVISIIVFKAYHDQKRKRIMIVEAYNTDSLTGLKSNALFLKEAADIIEKAQPGEYELISFDIDLFRSINNYYSVETGTAVIISIAKALNDAFKGSAAIYARSGVDEFMILRRVDECGSVRTIYTNHILPKIQEIIGDRYNLSASFGYVIIEDCSEKLVNLAAHADAARLSGKKKHKTTFVQFDQQMRDSYNNKLRLTFRMEQAMKDGEFVVHYQPKIDLFKDKIGGAEALIRWYPKLGNPIYPNEFIGVFEENGFIAAIDLYVVDQVARFIKANHNKMKIPVISVNLSAITIMENKVVNDIIRILDSHGVERDRIEIEITESAILSSEDKFLIVIKQFKNAGFTISLDDFGKGVSSLNRLSNIDVDVLKLDEAFIDLSENIEKTAVVVRDVISLAKHLKMKTVAEGVETYEQARWLKLLNCEYAQGYFFAKPMPEEDFKKALIADKDYRIDNVEVS